VINTAGPNGWLDWTYDYRNMLIHRARRLVMKQLRPRSSRIFGPDGREVIRVDVLEQMSIDPDRSDVEVLLSGEAPVLTEDATKTLSGLFRTIVKVAEEVAPLLSRCGVFVARDQIFSSSPESNGHIALRQSEHASKDMRQEHWNMTRGRSTRTRQLGVECVRPHWMMISGPDGHLSIES